MILINIEPRENGLGCDVGSLRIIELVVFLMVVEARIIISFCIE